MRTHPWLIRLLLPPLLLLLPENTRALEVQAHFFGFDGTAAPGRVSILSVQLVNSSSQVYDGPVAVSTSGAMGGVNGVPQEIDVFLAPGASRWIQTPVLVDPSSYFDGGVLIEWDLQSPFRGSQKLDAAKAGPPATVYLADESNPLAARPRVHAFLENLWPISLDPAVGGLHAVVMDHAPRWEAIREQVFMDWLRLGGVVHLLHGTDDRPPVFSGALTPLNDPADTFRVGAGRVHRHAVRAAALKPEELARRAGPSPAFASEQDNANGLQERGDTNNINQMVFDALRNRIKPDHAWGLITLVLLVYIVLIGPGTTLLARRWKNSRGALLFFCLVVAGASLIVYRIGRRGYGESTRCLSMIHARHTGAPGPVSVRQWMHVFSTNGRRYELRHPLKPVWFHSQSRERIRGTFRGGGDGRFTIDMPVFSSVDYLAGGYREMPDFRPVVELDKNRRLVLRAEQSVLPPGTTSVYVVAPGEEPQSLLAGRDILSGLARREIMLNQWGRDSLANNVDALGDFERATRVIAAALLLDIGAPNTFHQTRILNEREQMLRVFAIAPAPGGTGLANEEFSAHDGLVIHEAVIPLPLSSEARP